MSYRTVLKMKSINSLLISGGITCLLLANSCIREDDPYRELPHHGEKAVRLSALECSNFKLDGSSTSLEGQWLMKDSLLYFIDSHVVGVNVFDLSGEFMTSNINHGRGPDELLSPSEYSCLDTHTNNLVIYDTNYAFQVFDESFHKDYSSEVWVWLASKMYDKSTYSRKIVNNPKPSYLGVYDYNFMSNRISSRDGCVTLPVIIEHPKYNGYDPKSNARQYWKYSSIFLSFDVHNITGSYRLFGNYPPVYRTMNCPIFSTYDFVEFEDRYIVSFAADPNLYVMDLKGNLLYSFGVPGDNVSCRYPSTKSFQEYEAEYASQRKRFGYYDRLYFNGGLLLREYYDDGSKWHLQVYENDTLIGEFQLDSHLEIFGYHDGCYYALKQASLEDENFIITKFKLS